MNISVFRTYVIAITIFALGFNTNFTFKAYADKPEIPGNSDNSNKKDKEDKDDNDRKNDDKKENDDLDENDDMDENDDLDENDDMDENDDLDEGETKKQKVQLKLEQSLSGDLKFEVKIKNLPQGEYDIHVEGINRGSLIVEKQGNITTGRILFRTNPTRSEELLLNFEILGKLVEIFNQGTSFYSGYTPLIPEQDDDTEIEENTEEGSTELKSIVTPTEFAPTSASMVLKLEKEYDGSVELKVEFVGLEPGVYDIWIGGLQRANIQILASGKNYFVKFVASPENENEYLLNFELVGKTIELKQEALVIFSSVITVPVNSPILLEHGVSEYSSIATKLFPDPTAQILADGRKHSDWFGYYDDSSFPILEHCVLGQLEYRYDNSRNLLVSNSYGVLEILRNTTDESVAYYSFETGQYLSVSPTTQNCELLEPNAIFNNEGLTYQESVLPDADDVEGYYDLAFKATQKTQIKSAVAIQMVQNGNLKEAISKLTDAEFHRNLAVHNANRVIQAAHLKNEAIDFWTKAAEHLIETADFALIAAQEAFLAAQ